MPSPWIRGSVASTARVRLVHQPKQPQAGRENANPPPGVPVVPLHRQVRGMGSVTPIDDAESTPRTRPAKPGRAWASAGEVLDDRRARPRRGRDRGALPPGRARPPTGAATASHTRRSRCGKAGPTGSTTASAATGRRAGHRPPLALGRAAAPPSLDQRDGVRHEPRSSQSFQIGLRLAARQLSCTPRPGPIAGSQGAAAQGRRDLVEVGGDRVVGNAGRKCGDVAACGSGLRRAVSSTCSRVPCTVTTTST
jgi:hypothetical protein